MRIVIVGAGKVGSLLCGDLSGEGHHITLIEIKEDRLQTMLDQHEILGVQGNGSFYDVQMEAGVDTADMFISVTPEDEVNIISCVIAKRLGAKYTIARVRTPEHANHMSFVRDSLGITRMINPDLEAAQEIYRMIRYPSALSVEPFAGNRINLVELMVREESDINALTLAELRRRYKDLIVCLVIRDDVTMIPDGTTRLTVGDRVFLTGKQEDLGALYRKMGTVDRIRSVMVIGGGRITRYLMELLKTWKLDKKVIEQNSEAVEELAAAFPDVSVVEGDGTDQNLLDLENISGFDCVVTLTGIDEENIILSLFAASREVPRTITKVNRTDLLPLLRNMQLQSVITPAQLVTNYIVRFVRAISNSEGSQVEALYRLPGSSAEVLQFLVGENARVAGKRIKDLPIKDDVLIACIIINQQMIVPTGDDIMKPGQHVLVVTTQREFDDLDDILE